METFEGYISVLYPELKVAFEKGGPVSSNIGRVINAGLMDAVRTESLRRPLVSPKANLDTKQIVLDEGFLSYLWCFSYFMLGVTDIYHEKAMENPSIIVVRLSDSPRFAMFNATLAWGRSLKDTYSAWPVNLPNPCQNDDLTILTNRLWLYVVRYFMYHELGHLDWHSTSINLAKNTQDPFFRPTSDERRRLRMMEVQADRYALELFLSSDEGEYDRYLKYLGAAVAYLASFFLLHDSDTRGDIHPDLDERLRGLLKKVEGLGELRHTLLLNAVNIGIQSFMSLMSVDYIPEDMTKPYNDFVDVQRDLFKIIDELKKKYNLYMPFTSPRTD